VLAGLEAMHELGTGHLDIKPSNVVVRRGGEAVLVDFGLSGRRIRRGCGTGPYGAPEVWGVVPNAQFATPAAADVYSFACLAFELLTGSLLFEAPNEVAQIAMHVAHDGEPERMRLLATNPGIRPLVEVLGNALRRDPRERPSASDLRREIRSVARMVEETPWPVPLAGPKKPKLELVLDTTIR
jgi:serine/threonine protein kinase